MELIKKIKLKFMNESFEFIIIFLFAENYLLEWSVCWYFYKSNTGFVKFWFDWLFHIRGCIHCICTMKANVLQPFCLRYVVLCCTMRCRFSWVLFQKYVSNSIVIAWYPNTTEYKEAIDLESACNPFNMLNTFQTYITHHCYYCCCFTWVQVCKFPIKIFDIDKRLFISNATEIGQLFKMCQAVVSRNLFTMVFWCIRYYYKFQYVPNFVLQRLGSCQIGMLKKFE